MFSSLVWGFLRRDFKIALSYRMAFVLQLFMIFLFVPIFYFMGAMVDESTNSKFLQAYGGSYFGFLLIGVALVDYLAVSLRSFSRSLRESQLTGTLEIVLLSPSPLAQVLLCSSIYFFLFTTFRFVLYLGVGAVLGLEIQQMNVTGAVLVLFLGVLSFIPFGILSASVVMLIKRGEALGTLVSGASLFFGGVLFPVASMPDSLQLVSRVLPFTYALDGMRKAIQMGVPTIELVPQILVLIAFVVTLLPLSLAVFTLAVRRTRKTGTLTSY